MLSLLSTIYMYMHGVIIAADISLYYNITHIGMYYVILEWQTCMLYIIHTN